MKTGALIIADGHEREKEDFRPLLPAGDSTVIRRIIITMKQAGVDPVVVVTGREGDALEKHISGLDAICLRNQDYENTQMFHSICMGLDYIRNLCERVFILPAKFPMFLPGTIRKMMDSQAPVVCPVRNGLRGHPVLLSGSVLDQITSYQGEAGLQGAMGQDEILNRIQEVEVEDEGIILAVENREDCARPGIQGGKIGIHPQIQIKLGRNQVFFSPFMARFLSLIDYTGSIQTACRQLHISYTKGWSLLKEAQQQIGFPVLVTQAGGLKGGFSQLTPRAQDFLDRYLKMEKELNQEGERLFRQFFPEYAQGEEKEKDSIK